MNPKSSIKLGGQISSLIASIIAMYSASLVDNAIVDCSVDLQLTRGRPLAS